MKKMMLVAAACALVASPAILSADTVTSVNVVGYYSVTIPADGQALVTPILEDMEGATFEDLVGDQMEPGKASAYIWDRQTKNYKITNYDAFGTWDSNATNIVLRGDGIWLLNSDASPVTVTFKGEVPGEYNNATTTTVHNVTGLDAVGYSYPVDTAWTNTTLSASLPGGSSIYYWNTDTQTYTIGNKDAFGTWDAPARSLTLQAGSGFWVQTPDPVGDWSEGVPYDL